MATSVNQDALALDELWTCSFCNNEWNDKSFCNSCKFSHRFTEWLKEFKERTERCSEKEQIMLALAAGTLSIGTGFLGGLIGMFSGSLTKYGLLRGAQSGVIAGVAVSLQVVQWIHRHHEINMMRLNHTWGLVGVFNTYLQADTILELKEPVRGLSETSLKRLSREIVGYPSQEINEECAICYLALGFLQPFRRLEPCGHFYHVKCIDRWLTRKGSCPKCRRIVPVSTRDCMERGQEGEASFQPEILVIPELYSAVMQEEQA